MADIDGLLSSCASILPPGITQPKKIYKLMKMSKLTQYYNCCYYDFKSKYNVQGGANKTGQILTFKQMNIKSSILKILFNFKNWQAK